MRGNYLVFMLKAWFTQDRLLPLVLITILVFVAVFVFYLLWSVPIRYISRRRSLLQEKDVLELENDYRSTLAQIVGGLLVLLGLFFTVSELQNSRKTFELNQRSQEAERYSKAIEHLSKNDALNEIGGIVALEAIAEAHEQDYMLSVTKTFTAYVQVKSPWKQNDLPSSPEAEERNLENLSQSPVIDAPLTVPEPISTNVQEVLTFIGKSAHKDSNDRSVRLNLSLTNLRQADMRNGNFGEVDFRGIYGLSADFTAAKLNRANFGRRVFPNDRVQSTFLKCANFNQAELEQTAFNHADLSGAHFYQAKLKNTVFSLANVSGAYFQGADLRETDITQEQIDSAMVDDQTQLREGLVKTPQARANKSTPCEPQKTLPVSELKTVPKQK